MLLLYTYRLMIEKAYLKWCEDNGVAKLPNTLVSYMHSRGWLNEEKIIEDLKPERIKWIQSTEHYL